MKPTLLLLPGLLCDETVWRAQVAAFSSQAEVRVPDYGDSDRITAMAEIALEGAPARFSLAGHSMGARVALEVLRLAPEQVERLALLDTGVHGVKPNERETRMQLVDLAREEGMDALCEAWLPPMVHPDRRHDDAFMAPLRAMVARSTPERFAAQIEALLNRPDTEPVLAAIRCPLLIGVGREDAWSPVDQHKDILEQTGRGRLAVFENAGHMAPFEAPESVNSALAEWFDETA
ncbi:alpha/beta fold hydrolase [Hyphococcus luteus]|uniref:Alpha/beta hydrolase n=1 Tax=Hyphococcus luteus TaxID=2058213 RepID=A0A2S7K383_9PROT|nr:alpha/beta hydrolase [Marinicaulis flavus]PQA86955.1 alpha/beta hydrolase [Marinicaulis flavus]